MHVNQNLIYRELTKDPSNIYSLLLMSGYLKVSWKELMPDGLYLCELSIPNKEISMVYKQEILSYLVETGFMSRSTADQIAISLYTMNFKKLQDTLSEYMTHSISFYDGGTEGFYHGMIIGLVAMLDNKYHVRSNRESGDGRYDVCLFPKEKEYPGIIMEFK